MLTATTAAPWLLWAGNSFLCIGALACLVGGILALMPSSQPATCPTAPEWVAPPRETIDEWLTEVGLGPVRRVREV